MAPVATKSFSVRELRDALPRKSGPSSMPYEIFLKIVDALVADAEDECEPILHWVTLHPDMRGQLLIMDNQDYTRSIRSAPHRKRYRLISPLLKLDTRSRAHIQATAFRPVEMIFKIGLQGDGFVRVAWVCPAMDRFMPWTGERYKIPGLKNVLLHPSPSTAPVVNSMRSITVNVTELFRYTYIKDFTDLLEMPRVQEMCINAGMVASAAVVKPQDRHIHTQDLPIDPILFPELANWERKYGDALFKKIAPTLRERSIKVYVFVSDRVEMDILELFHTPQGIRMRFLDPVCKCYKFHIPDRMKPNGGGGRLKGKARRAAKAGKT